MEFPFPPPPAGYDRAIIARWCSAVLVVLAIGFIVQRVRDKPLTRRYDDRIWLVTIVVSGILTFLGMSPRGYGDDFVRWPLFVSMLVIAPVGLQIAGVRHKEHIELIGIPYVVLAFGWFLQNPLAHGPEPNWRTQCKNNLKQIGLALYNFHDNHDSFPVADGGDPPVSWRVSILPFFDASRLEFPYDRTKAWDEQPNRELASQKRYHHLFVCPSSYVQQDTQGRWFTAYSMPTGPHTVGASPAGTTIKDITDGTSNTLFVVEACGAQIVWTEPRDVDIASQPTGVNLNGAKPGQSAGWMSSYHWGGTQVLMADGSVKFLSANTDPALLKKLATVDGGEEVGDY